MRTFGYALLIIGFAWLAVDSLAVRARARSIAFRHVQQLPDRPAVTRQEVVESVYQAVYELAGAWPWFWLPGLCMLGGGILLDRAKVARELAARAAPGESADAGSLG